MSWLGCVLFFKVAVFLVLFCLGFLLFTLVPKQAQEVRSFKEHCIKTNLAVIGNKGRVAWVHECRKEEK